MGRRKRKKLTKEKKDQIAQKKEIRGVFSKIGFRRIDGVEGKNFVFDGRQSELDDIFVLENVILIVEYTIGTNYKEHLAKKSLFYQKVLNDPKAFVSFLCTDNKFSHFQEFYNTNIKTIYPNMSQLHVRIVYCSKSEVSKEYRQSLKDIRYYDFYVSHYFKYLSDALRLSALDEMLEFLDIDNSLFGKSISQSSESNTVCKAYVLPEVKSFFKTGYKIVTFYMDPESILKRAYVLRHEGWKEKSSSIYYQRMAKPNRISEIRKYLATERRVFVNNIIVTMSATDVVFYDEKGNIIEMDDSGVFKEMGPEVKTSVVQLSLRERAKSIGIIDGQHRLFAYHKDIDPLESVISDLRREQNLLVTGIVFPRNEVEEERRKYEARLFREINVKQAKIPSQLEQELSLMVEPFSITSIGKDILSKLSESGPLEGRLERYSFETGKVKSVSIVSFGLKPLIKIEESTDSLFSIWDNPNKEQLLTAKKDANYQIRSDYIDFCVEAIRSVFIGVKANIPSDEWRLYSPKDKKGLLSITFINGFLNLLRFIIENDKKLYSQSDYLKKFKGLYSFDFRSYKTSHYRAMGGDLYEKFFK